MSDLSQLDSQRERDGWRTIVCHYIRDLHIRNEELKKEVDDIKEIISNAIKYRVAIYACGDCAKDTTRMLRAKCNVCFYQDVEWICDDRDCEERETHFLENMHAGNCKGDLVFKIFKL